MSTAQREGRLFEMSGGADAARADLEDFFNGLDWRPRVLSPARIDFERGNRTLTILLGALAGRRFFLTAQIEILERGSGVEVGYRWGAGAGQALGGTLGRHRAARAHAETATALEQTLRRGGRLVRVRSL